MTRLIMILLLALSCNSHEVENNNTELKEDKTTGNDLLRRLFLENAQRINSSCDTIAFENNDNDKRQKNKSVWMSTTTVFERNNPNIFGEIATKAGGSAECVVVEVTVYNLQNRYNSRSQKNRIMITAVDSGCLKNVLDLNLKLDSTEKFIFGINKNVLQ